MVLSSAFGRQPSPPRPSGRLESEYITRFAVPSTVVVAGRPRSRFLFRNDGGGHVITAAIRAADGGDAAAAICRAGGGGNQPRNLWCPAWRRHGCQLAALLTALRTASGLGSRATRAVLASVHRPRCHRRQLSDLLASVRNDFDVSWLPGCSAGGTVSAARMALGAPALDPWFSVSKVDSDGRR